MGLSDFKSRLQFEKNIVQYEMPQFRLYQMGDEYYFLGRQTTTALGRQYNLKLIIPAWYPDQMPSLFVVSPLTLPKYGHRGTINSEGVSHQFHTQNNGPKGCVQICHFKPERWDASQTCVGVFLKGQLWLEAYDFHLCTGLSIAEILKNWKRRQ
jgi:ubiquitin-protein ligase